MKYESTDKDKRISRLPTKTAAIYVRVSSKEQVDNYSIPTQLTEIRKYLEQNKIVEVGSFIEEGESAKTANRTQLLNLLHFVAKNKAKVDYVVVYKLDRWARDVADHHITKRKLAAGGTGLLSCTEATDDSPQGRMIESMMSAIAQFDNEQKGVRVKQAMLTKALDGWYPVKAPYGYKNDKNTKRLVTDEYFEPLQASFKMFLRDASIPDLAEYLNDLGMRNTVGKPFTPKAVWHILDNSKFYAGKYEWADYPDDIQGKHEPMISWYEHLRVQEQLHYKPQLAIPQDDPEQTFILNFSIAPAKGFLHCAECGKRFVHSRARGNGGTYWYYYCNNAACTAEKKSTPKKSLEDKFRELLVDITPSEDYVEFFGEIVKEEWHKNNEQKETLYQQSQDELSDLNRQKSSLIRMRAKGELDEQDYAQELSSIKTEIARYEIVESENVIDYKELEKLLDGTRPFLTNLEPHYNRFPVKQKRDMAEMIFPNGVTYADGGFRTMEKSELFKYFEVLQSGNLEDCNDLTPRGIEPRLSE